MAINPLPQIQDHLQGCSRHQGVLAVLQSSSDNKPHKGESRNSRDRDHITRCYRFGNSPHRKHQSRHRQHKANRR